MCCLFFLPVKCPDFPDVQIFYPLEKLEAGIWCRSTRRDEAGCSKWWCYGAARPAGRDNNSYQPTEQSTQQNRVNTRLHGTDLRRCCDNNSDDEFTVRMFSSGLPEVTPHLWTINHLVGGQKWLHERRKCTVFISDDKYWQTRIKMFNKTAGTLKGNYELVIHPLTV